MRIRRTYNVLAMSQIRHVHTGQDNDDKTSSNMADDVYFALSCCFVFYRTAFCVILHIVDDLDVKFPGLISDVNINNFVNAVKSCQDIAFSSLWFTDQTISYVNFFWFHAFSLSLIADGKNCMIIEPSGSRANKRVDSLKMLSVLPNYGGGDNMPSLQKWWFYSEILYKW